MRILVTGSKGFTGHYVKMELEQNGHEVFSLKNNLAEHDAIADEIKHANPEAVIHLAAVAFIKHGDPVDFYKINLIESYHFLAALEKYAPNMRCILLVSSANVYGNTEEPIVTENTPTNPYNDYAVSKLAMEYMAKTWLNRLPIFIVRPFNYTGIGQHENFLIPKIVRHFINKSPIIELGNINVWREFGDVRTVANIYRKLIEIHPVGKTINICTGEAYSLREVLKIATELTGHHIDIKINPKFVRVNEIERLAGDNTLLASLIAQWKHYSFEETLEWMLASHIR